MSSPDTKPRRDPWILLGLTIAALSAAVSSFDGLRLLAMATGWSGWQAPLLPLTVDAFALSAIRIWLLGSTVSSSTRSLARSGAIGAVALSLTGNGFWHLHSSGLVPVHWMTVLLVGASPPVVLAVVVHLTAVHRQVDSYVLKDVPSTDGSSQDGPRYGSEDALLAAARKADASYRARYGRRITRDALRRELRIGGQRATEVRRQLEAEEAGEGKP
jgi:Protein of unknown function (DUF2637)